MGARPTGVAALSRLGLGSVYCTETRQDGEFIVGMLSLSTLYMVYPSYSVRDRVRSQSSSSQPMSQPRAVLCSPYNDGESILMKLWRNKRFRRLSNDLTDPAEARTQPWRDAHGDARSLSRQSTLPGARKLNELATHRTRGDAYSPILTEFSPRFLDESRIVLLMPWVL